MGVATMANKNTLFMMLVAAVPLDSAASFFTKIRQICSAYEWLRCLDVKIWWFFDNDNNRTSCISFVHVHGIINVMCIYIPSSNLLFCGYEVIVV